jgi:nucleotide-binding universal stress UspA family protein
MYKRILVPTDGSKFANEAAREAILIADKFNAEIIAIYVIEESRLEGIRKRDLITKMKELLTQEARKALKKVTKILEETEKDVKITFKTRQGKPADEILKAIKKDNIELTVMGTAGKHGLNRFWFGSVAENVVRYATCPVLVVH